MEDGLALYVRGLSLPVLAEVSLVSFELVAHVDHDEGQGHHRCQAEPAAHVNIRPAGEGGEELGPGSSPYLQV